MSEGYLAHAFRVERIRKTYNDGYRRRWARYSSPAYGPGTMTRGTQPTSKTSTSMNGRDSTPHGDPDQPPCHSSYTRSTEDPASAADYRDPSKGDELSSWREGGCLPRGRHHLHTGGSLTSDPARRTRGGRGCQRGCDHGHGRRGGRSCCSCFWRREDGKPAMRVYGGQSRGESNREGGRRRA